MMRVIFCVDLDKSRCRPIKSSKTLNLQMVQRPKSIFEVYTEKRSFMALFINYKDTDSFLKSLFDFKGDIGSKYFFYCTELHGMNQ
jgi:hypothetical protein